MKKILIISILIFFISISVVSAAENVTDNGVSEENNNVEKCSVSENIADTSLVSENGDVEKCSVSENVTDNGIGEGNDVGKCSLLQKDFQENSLKSKSLKSNSFNNGSKRNSTPAPVVKIKSSNFVAYYKIKPVYKVRLVDSKGKPVAGKEVKFKLKGKYYTKKTNSKGFASLKIKLKPGKHKVKVAYGKTLKKHTIKLFKSRTSSTKNIKSTYGKKVIYRLKVVDNYGKLMKKTLVAFKVDKKVYRTHTNKKGIASLKLNSNSGKHVIQYFVNGLHGKNKYVVKNKITLKILKWGIKGNHIKIPLIRKNMPNNPWVKKVVAATKKGLPFITFQGGKGKRVFITAGVHGNEIPAQVAVMRLIQYLSKKPIKGTVHIIPFVNIYAAYHKVRLTNYDFNRVANVHGTVSNKIVNLIVKLKCDCYGDFHSTESPGDPGLNIILGFYSPKKSVEMTNYLAKSCNVHKRFHYTGGIHLWTLADWATYKGIPSVLCEVISKVSTVSKFNSALSYKMMNRFLKFSSII